MTDGYYWKLKTEAGRKYDPDQPRVPAGSSDGGQWTSGGGTVSRQVVDYEDEIRGEGVEHLGLFDEEGNLLYEAKGGPQGLRMTEREFARLQIAARSDRFFPKTFDRIMTHNHPTSDAIFGYDDLETARDIGLAELRLVMPDGTRYSVSPKGRARGEMVLQWPTKRAIKEAMLKKRPEMEALTAEIKQALADGSMTRIEAAEVLWNESWPYVADEVGLDFTKEAP